MVRQGMTAVAVLMMVVSTAAAQDAKTVLGNAARAMGIENVTSIHFYGTAAAGNLGQNNNANQPWPMAAMNDYVRAIDFSQPASRATWANYAVPVTGGRATLVHRDAADAAADHPRQPGVGAAARDLDHALGLPERRAGQQRDRAGTRPSTARRYQVVTWNAPIKSPGGQPYRLVGYINAQNLVDRVQTWVENPIFGDMLVEADYSHYRDNNGLKFPAQHRPEARRLADLRGLYPGRARKSGEPAGAADADPAAGGARRRSRAVPGGPGGAAAGPTSEKLAEGVFRINGAYNALAVEFADHIVLFEPGPQNEARALAIIAETKKVIPNKPIRYGVISHHHFDHTERPAGRGRRRHHDRDARGEQGNFLMTALSAPRTLAPDSLSKSGKKPVVEGFTGDKRVFQDGTRTFEVHVIKGLPHADGLVVGYLPKEKLLVYADMFNLPPANDPVPNPPVTGTGVSPTTSIG